jgi:hypothetical protein
MAKRRQTTGLPKARKKKSIATSEVVEGGKLKREHQTQAEREEAYQRYLIWIISGVIAVIVLVLAIAFLKDKVIDPKRTVATINNQEITVQAFQDRVRFERLLVIGGIDAQIDIWLNAGFTDDVFEVLNQLYQADPNFRASWDSLDPSTRDLLGFRVLNDMIDDILVRQEAERLDIIVSQEDIDGEIYEYFYYDPTLDTATDGSDAETSPEITPEPLPPTPTPFVSPTPMPEPTALPTSETEPTADSDVTVPTAEPTQISGQYASDFDQNLEVFYNRASAEANMSREEVNAYFETQALRKALSKVAVETDTTSIWANARHILVTTEQEALDIVEALNSGESFADLARINSLDTGSGEQGGELDWADTNNYVDEFAEAVRTLPIGAISAPVQSQFGFHIIQVRERENRELDEAYVDYNREQDFADWVNTLRDRDENEYDIKGDLWLDYVPQTPQWAPR